MPLLRCKRSPYGQEVQFRPGPTNMRGWRNDSVEHCQCSGGGLIPPLRTKLKAQAPHNRLEAPVGIRGTVPTSKYAQLANLVIALV